MDYWKNKKIPTFKGELKYLKDFTQEELIYEKVKCATDSIHVIETYFYIFDQTKNNNKGEIVPFILFPFQKDLIGSYEENRFNITNKYRQAGISTVTCAWLATYVAFNSNRSVAIVANKLETARDELMKDVTNFIDMLPPFLHPKISDKDAANHKVYMNGSQVKAFATNSLRGYTPTFLFWDEAAWCDNGESFWTGTLPTLSTGGNAALVSCVVGDTMVWTDRGLQQIKERVDVVKKGGYSVKPYYVLGRNEKRKGFIMFNNGYNKTKIIENEYTSIECTLPHKLWTYSNKTGEVGYNNAAKICKNDYLAIQYGDQLFGNIDEIKYIAKPSNLNYFNYLINNDLIDFVAIYLHKGKLINSRNKGLTNSFNIEFTNLTEDEFEVIRKFLDIFSDYKEKYKYDKNFILLNPYIGNIVYNLGLYYDKKYDTITNRTLPKLIRSLKKEYIIRLIKKWIFFYENKIIYDKKFKIKHKSIIFLKEIQQILLNYGILSKLEKRDNLKLSDGYILDIECEYDNFISDDDYIPDYDYIIPMGIIEKINIIFKKYNIDLPFNRYNKKYILSIIENIKDILHPKDKDELNKYISKNILWTRVINIKTNKAITYDFSLNNNDEDYWAHSVIYNGIIGHQTPNGLDPVFYKTYDNARNGVSEFKANELHWYYDPRYSKDLLWRKKDDKDVLHEIKETNKEKYQELLENGWKPWSPWFEAMASKFNYDKKKIAQELECVTGETIITVKNNLTGLIENIKIEDLYERIYKKNNKSNNIYKVLNHKGDFVDFYDIIKKEVDRTIKFICENNYILECTENHILITKNGQEISKNININDSILTDSGFKKIIKIEKIENLKSVYDLVNVGTDSLYLTNGIVSHNCSFLGSGNNFVDEENIRRIENTQVKNPIRMEYDDFFWIWEDPIKDGNYVMSVDVSTGAGDDYSTIIILKQLDSHLEQVAEFKHKVSPDTLGVIANDYGKRYNNAYAIVDITGGIGAMTMKTMLELGYTNIHYVVSRHEPTKEKLSDYIKEDENGKSLVPGFVISTSNRGMVLTEMKRAIEANEVEIKSYRLVSEFKTFITTPNARVADHRRSFNDDLVIALAMAIYVYSYDIRSSGMSIERTKKMLEAITNITTDNSNGNSTSSTNNIFNINPNNPYVANSWLFKGLK